jgi:hypothetical protein
MKFTVNITLGNDAMKTNSDLAIVLCNIANKLVTSKTELRPNTTIFDINGNNVGYWKLTKSRKKNGI